MYLLGSNIGHKVGPLVVGAEVGVEVGSLVGADVVPLIGADVGA